MHVLFSVMCKYIISIKQLKHLDSCRLDVLVHLALASHCITDRSRDWTLVRNNLLDTYIIIITGSVCQYQISYLWPFSEESLSLSFD